MRRGGAFRGALAAAALLLLASSADAQIFFGARPDPPFTIGPLMIRARVAEEGNAVTLHVLWSLVPAAGTRPADVAQDLYLLWPGEVRDGGVAGGHDRELSKFVEDRGFSVIGEGRLPLAAQSWAQAGRGAAEPASSGASFVVFVLEGGALGLSPPATLIRIPWTPRLAEPGWLLELTMRVPGIVKPGKVTWAEHLFVGGRFLLSLSYNEVRERPLFPMYLALRDHVVRLADAPAELAVTFAQSDRLKIDQVFPPTSIRRLSETEESTEVVSLFLDKTDGVTPQNLAVQFGYFSKVQAWALVLIPTLFFVLGQAIGPVIGRTAVRLVNWAGTRVHLGSWNGVPRPRESGVVLGRDALEKIVPGETTAAEVVRLCGPVAEQLEQYPASDRRTLVFRGRRDVPRTRRVFGWLSTVAHWEVEQHEVRVEIGGDVVRDVQATIRSFRAGTAEPPEAEPR